MDQLEEKLKQESIPGIVEYLKECQTNYYISGKNKIYKDFLYGIDEYDKLVKSIDLDENNLVLNEMIDREKFLDVISIFKTGIYNLYFVRMEQYGYADEDAVVYRLAFVQDIKELFTDCKDYMEKSDFIKDRDEPRF